MYKYWLSRPRCAAHHKTGSIGRFRFLDKLESSTQSSKNMLCLDLFQECSKFSFSYARYTRCCLHMQWVTRCLHIPMGLRWLVHQQVGQTMNSRCSRRGRFVIRCLHIDHHHTLGFGFQKGFQMRLILQGQRLFHCWVGMLPKRRSRLHVPDQNLLPDPLQRRHPVLLLTKVQNLGPSYRLCRPRHIGKQRRPVLLEPSWRKSSRTRLRGASR